jgi:uncharacterized phiE125 gp8 family phage protein
MSSRVIVEPPAEPLTLEQVKTYHAVSHSLHDDMLTALITAARRNVEGNCGISLVTQTRELGFDCFSTYLQLDFGPVQEIVSLEYTGSDGVVAALTDYRADLVGGRIQPAYNAVWPTIQAGYNAVVVRYVAGFTPVEGSPTDYVSSVPADLVTAMQLLVGNWYDNREASVTGTINQPLEMGVAALLAPYRRRLGWA